MSHSEEPVMPKRNKLLFMEALAVNKIKLSSPPLMAGSAIDLG